MLLLQCIVFVTALKPTHHPPSLAFHYASSLFTFSLHINVCTVYITTTLIGSFCSLLQLIMIWRINVRMGIPDIFFAIGDEAGNGVAVLIKTCCCGHHAWRLQLRCYITLLPPPPLPLPSSPLLFVHHTHLYLVPVSFCNICFFPPLFTT